MSAITPQTVTEFVKKNYDVSYKDEIFEIGNYKISIRDNRVLFTYDLASSQINYGDKTIVRYRSNIFTVFKKNKDPETVELYDDFYTAFKGEFTKLAEFNSRILASMFVKKLNDLVAICEKIKELPANSGNKVDHLIFMLNNLH